MNTRVATHSGEEPFIIINPAVEARFGISIALASEAMVASVPAPLRPRVLVVEDVDALRDVVRDDLDAAGFEVDTTAASAEALDRLATRRYTRIIADCYLPDLPVLDWLAALRGAAPTTPLVLCSGTVSDELRSYATEFGAVAVLEKPFSVDQLRAAVRAALGTEAGQR